MRSVPTLQLTERVTSGPGSGTQTGYRLTGKALLASELYLSGAADVRPIGARRGLTELAFALPASNVWYRMTIDRSYRILAETIVSSGHLIQRRFTYAPSAASGVSVPPLPAAPRPPVAAFTLAREADDLAVGLSAQPDSDRLLITADVRRPDGRGAAGLGIGFRLRTSTATMAAAAQPCGPGCYRAVLPITGKPEQVLLRLERPGRRPTVLRYPFPERWPPSSAVELVRRATRVYRGLRAVVYRERVASSARNVVWTTWRVVAPDRLEYRIDNGPAGILIGNRRWDRDKPGGSWQASPQSPIREPIPPWGTTPSRATLVGSARVSGRPVWVVSFADPSVPIWFTVSIDKQTYRTLDLRMVTAAHFMHQRYTAFNERVAIEPPR